VYAFALILAVFLLGLGAGSGLGSLLLKRGIRPLTALGHVQLLLCPAIGWASYLITQALPYWSVPERVRADLWLTFQLDLVRALLVVLPGPGCGVQCALGDRRGPDASGSRARRRRDLRG
jgi:hypothetical protein